MIKSRKVRWARHVTRMGDNRNAYKILVGKPKEREIQEYLHVSGRIILKCI
jgi:hypothetical protein